MKLIISRKGFDSQYGGVPSPVFPDGSIVSLPIPSEGDDRILGDLCHGDINIGDLAADLTNNRLGRESHVHFDPDLYGPILERKPGWKPAFGQVSAAQSHLANQGVGEGDIFLFYGWFRRIECYGGHWRYVRGVPSFHSIFGWLQVGEVVKVNERTIDLYPWLHSHPHVSSAARFKGSNNTIYVGADWLTHGQMPLELGGGGVFPKFDHRLCLTADESNRSLWKLPAWFYPKGRLSSLSYHGNLNRWSQQGDSVLLHSVPKGQEFVLNCDHYPESVSWIEDLFASCAQGLLEPHP